MESRSKHSRTHDSILAMLKTHRLPRTREKYLELYFAPGPVPDDISPEVEASFPAEFEEVYPSVEDVVLDSPWRIQ